MSIKVTYSEGAITFNLVDLLEYVPREQIDSIVESLSCHDQILAHVAEQIATGCTENGFSGSRQCAPAFSENSGTALDKAIRRVAKASNDIARKEIERLERALVRVESSLADYMSKCEELEEKLRRFA